MKIKKDQINKAIDFVKTSKLSIDKNANEVAKILKNNKAKNLFIELSPDSISVEQLINDIVKELKTLK